MKRAAISAGFRPRATQGSGGGALHEARWRARGSAARYVIAIARAHRDVAGRYSRRAANGRVLRAFASGDEGVLDAGFAFKRSATRSD
jgi:hypothetical protein